MAPARWGRWLTDAARRDGGDGHRFAARCVGRNPPAAGADRPSPATERPAAAVSRARSVASLPSLPHLRRDLVTSLSLGLGLTLVVIVVGLAVG